MRFKTLDDLELSGRRVLIRADLNVPLRDGAVADSARIVACAPSVREIIGRGGKPIVISHLGRPEGKRVEALSLAPLCVPLGDALEGAPVHFASDCVGAAAESVVAGLPSGAVALLENLRFHAAEESNDPDFAGALAGLADVYVNDAFSVSHRAHASVVGVPRMLPAAAGRLLQRELQSLDGCLAQPRRPYAAVLGGAKVKSKFGLLRALAGRVDQLILAGAMANTFLAAEGNGVGRSVRENDATEEARRIREAAAASGCEILLPTDLVVARRLADNAPSETVATDAVPDDAMILDIGPATIERIVAALGKAQTVVWNGPLGAAETAGFDHGTRAVAAFIAERTGRGAMVSVAGGGDTAAILKAEGLQSGFTYVCLGGGAFVVWLEGRPLPGISALAGAGNG